MEPQVEFGQWVEVCGPACNEWIPLDIVQGPIEEYHNECKAISGEDWAGYQYEKEGIPLPPNLRPYCENKIAWEIRIMEGWGARLSAPGYLDCTEWTVFETEKEAEDYLEEEMGE